MKKAVYKIVAALVSALLLMSMLSGCGKKNNPADTAEPASTSAPAGTAAPAEIEVESGRRDGERFEDVIVIEGMEETVQYQHVRNEALGFEIDFDYENLERRSEANRECFVSVYDLPNAPENYLEVTYRAEDADTVAASYTEALSRDYDLLTGTRELARAGSCIRIEASELKGTGRMADQLQVVYIIPAADGCRVAIEHYAIESAEGFGRRFSYILNTLTVIAWQGEAGLSDQQALAAVRNYCCIRNPELESIVSSGEYPSYWEVVSSSEQEIVVLFRSYTGAQIRYYVDRATGNTHVTEFVPGITAGEQRTDESFNVRDYLGRNPSPAPSRDITGPWQTASMVYDADGSMRPEYYVWFTDTEIIYGHIKDGQSSFDHSDPISGFKEISAGIFRIQAEGANSVHYTYQTSETDPDIMEYYETWNENDFPSMYRGGASLSRVP